MMRLQRPITALLHPAAAESKSGSELDSLVKQRHNDTQQHAFTSRLHECIMEVEHPDFNVKLLDGLRAVERRLAAIIEEDIQRSQCTQCDESADESFIDLNQAEETTGRDTIMQLLKLYSRIRNLTVRQVEPDSDSEMEGEDDAESESESQAEPVAEESNVESELDSSSSGESDSDSDPESGYGRRESMDTIVWPWIIKLLSRGKASRDMTSKYDIHRRDHGGRTVLHYVSSASIMVMPANSMLHRLAELLLQLGVDPNATWVDSQNPLRSVSPPLIHMIPARMPPRPNLFDAVKLFLHYGADLNAKEHGGHTFIHHLIIYHQSDTLRQLYQRLPQHASTIDYAIRVKAGVGSPDGEYVSIVPFAMDRVEFECDDAALDTLKHIVAMLQQQRERQYQNIRQALTDATPLVKDLNHIIYEYIQAHDYQPHSSLSASSSSSNPTWPHDS